MLSPSLAELAEVFTQRNIEFVEEKNNLISKVEGANTYHQITFTDAPHHWIRAEVWIEPYGAIRVDRWQELSDELSMRFGHRTFIDFIQCWFTVYAFVRPDRTHEDIPDFIYACDRVVPLLSNLRVEHDAAYWDEHLLAAAFVEVETRMQ